MTGSVQQKNGKYYAVLNLYDERGKRKQKWIATGYAVKGNKKRAEKFLREAIKEHEEKESLINSDIMFSDYIRHWLNTAKISVDIVTHQNYEAIAKTHVIPYFGFRKAKLKDVTRVDLQEYFNHKHANGRLDGKGGLSPKTLHLHKIVIQQALKEAIRDNLILSNPCTLVKLPQLERYEYDFYNSEEIEELFEIIKDEPLRDFIRLTFVYGLRRSEALGLKWSSVNFGNNTITIKSTVSLGTKVVEKNKTKNKSSYRSFPLTEEAKDIIMRAKKKEETNRKLLGSDYQRNDYIFKWENGKPYSPHYIKYKFPQILKKYGLRHIRFHDLRHSTASYLISEGYGIKDIQDWLGHSDIKTTANIYAHLDVHRKNSIAETMMSSFSTSETRKIGA